MYFIHIQIISILSWSDLGYITNSIEYYSLEEYSDTSGKRRKRGSLFFRKKKEKNKTKNLTTTCDSKWIDYYIYDKILY